MVWGAAKGSFFFNVGGFAYCICASGKSYLMKLSELNFNAPVCEAQYGDIMAWLLLFKTQLMLDQSDLPPILCVYMKHHAKDCWLSATSSPIIIGIICSASRLDTVVFCII